MAEDATEGAAVATLIGVEHRLRFGLFRVFADCLVGGRQYFDLTEVSLEGPVGLVKQADGPGQAKADGVVGGSNLEVHGAVTPAGVTVLPGKSD